MVFQQLVPCIAHPRLAVADDEEALVVVGIAVELPHGAPHGVGAAPHEDVAVGAGLGERLIVGERPRRLRVGQIDHMQAAGDRRAIVGQGRSAGDHGALVAVHERPMLFDDGPADRRAARRVAAVEEILH